METLSLIKRDVLNSHQNAAEHLELRHRLYGTMPMSIETN